MKNRETTRATSDNKSQLIRSGHKPSASQFLKKHPALHAKLQRESVKQLIRQCAPYAGLVTIGFTRPYSDKFLIRSVNHILKRANEYVYGKSAFRSKKKCLRGLCFVEVGYKSYNLGGGIHFHILLLPDEIPPNEQFEASTIKDILLPFLRKAVPYIVDDKDRPITNMSCVDVTPYRKLGKLPGYLTKEFEKRGIEADGFWGVLSFDGIEGLDIPRNRKKRDRERGLIS